MTYILPDRVYQILKWIGLIVCHALSLLVLTVGTAWKLDSFTVTAIATTIEAIGVFIGSCIGVSAATAKPDLDATADLGRHHA